MSLSSGDAAHRWCNSHGDKSRVCRRFVGLIDPQPHRAGKLYMFGVKAGRFDLRTCAPRALGSHPDHGKIHLKTRCRGVEAASSLRATQQLRWGASPPTSIDGFPGGKKPFGPQNRFENIFSFGWVAARGPPYLACAFGLLGSVSVGGLGGAIGSCSSRGPPSRTRIRSLAAQPLLHFALQLRIRPCWRPAKPAAGRPGRARCRRGWAAKPWIRVLLGGPLEL
jgi:hypothetical protein